MGHIIPLPRSILNHVTPDGAHSEIGEGWYGLIDRMHEGLCAIDRNYRICQIKEKWGTLRVHLDGLLDYDNQTWDRLSEVIEAACAESAITCELCGEPGTARLVRTYVRTLCHAHLPD